MSSWLAFVVGAALLPFTALQTVLPAARWLAPVFLLRFSRQAVNTRVAFVGLSLAHAVASAIEVRGVFVPSFAFLPIPGAFVVALVAGVFLTLPYALDRALSRRLSGVPRTLVFPGAVTTLIFFSVLSGVFGSWGAPAYSQAGDLPLLQLLSVTGLWGVTYLVAWLAPVVNEVWEKGFDLVQSRRPVSAFAAVLVVVHLAGGARLALASPRGGAVPVASVVPGESSYRRVHEGWQPVALAKAEDPERKRVRPRLISQVGELFQRTQLAARAGARIVSWPECVPLRIPAPGRVFPSSRPGTRCVLA